MLEEVRQTALVVGLLAAIAIVLIVWRPWAHRGGPPEKGAEQTTTEGTLTTTEGTQPGTGTTAGTSALEILAGNPAANGASYKLFDTAGTVLASGTLPATANVPAGAKCKLVVNKTGYQPWEGWEAIGEANSTQNISVALDKIAANTVRLTVCTQTGRRATQWCPTTTRKEFIKGQEPGYCTLHKAPVTRVQVKVCTVTGRRANRYCPSTVMKTFDSDRVPGYCTVHRAPPPQQRTVTVNICLDSGKRATKHCPNVGQRTFPANDVPAYCTVHRPPPPGKPKATVRICDASGQRAGRYCPSTHTERMDANAIPPPCTMHTEPPGKSSAQSAQYKWCPECGTRNRAVARVCRKCGHRF